MHAYITKGLKNNVIWIDEFIPNKEMLELNLVSNVMLSLLLDDEMPISLFESMYLEPIPIISRITPLVYEMKDKHNCFFVNNHDSTEILQVLNFCIDNLFFS